MASFGPDKVVLPTGTDSNRPASPEVGFIRYNSDQSGVELYTDAGWIIGGGPLGSELNPATSGIAIYNAGITTTGNYWLTSSGTGDFQALVDMNHGGGWINITPTMGSMTNALTSSWGSGGSNILTGANTDPTSAISCGNSSQSQASVYGCPGQNGQSIVSLNSTFASQFNISEVRIRLTYISDDGNVTCGPYWTNSITSRTIIQGTSAQIDGACNNPPNRYSDRVGTGFTVEWYGPLSDVTKLLYAWTACGGSYTMRLDQLYVR
jgi:hypothetical protein